jgi:hypothetical protein
LVAAHNLRQVAGVDEVIAGMLEQEKDQAVISGVLGKAELLSATRKFLAAGITPVVMEDNLLGSEVDPIAYLDEAYEIGAVPTTYKMMTYELVKGIGLLGFSEAEKAAVRSMRSKSAPEPPRELLPRLR